jgi:hypothetical protein
MINLKMENLQVSAKSHARTAVFLQAARHEEASAMA